MRNIPGRYLVSAGTIVVLILFTVFWSGSINYPQINAYERWFSSKLVDNSERTTKTQDIIMCNETHSNETSNRELRSYPQLHNKTTTVNNITLYVTSHNIRHGRLGNQMFKYASIVGISQAQGRHMFIEPGGDIEKTFKLTRVGVRDGAKKWRVIREANPLSFDVKLMKLPLRDWRIRGYLQSYVYFASVMDEVRQEFIFQNYIANNAAKILHDVYVKHNASMVVGVHLRRGDFLAKKNKHLGYGVPEKSYFMKAFSLMKSKFPRRSIIFVVASDDLVWCRKNLISNDVIVLPPASSSVHLAVLSSCDHVIISGGTFGWWGGWLAGGYVIYYADYLTKDTRLGGLLNAHDYYPRTWIGLGN